nr:immunoglobulin light chain junction region [Macaca mulatta]
DYYCCSYRGGRTYIF